MNSDIKTIKPKKPKRQKKKEEKKNKEIILKVERNVSIEL